MTVQINYKNNGLKNPSANLVLFVDEKFNILNDVTSKEYHYYFAFGEKLHPFCASILCTNLNHLDIETMKSAALLFKGEHDFSAFIYKSNANSKTARKIMSAEIVENTELKANFFPSRLSN